MLLFAYGTLRSSYRNRWARLLRKNAVLLGPAEVQGKLYRMSGYPALRPSFSDAKVPGELWELRNPDVLILLDRYEGRSYERISVDAKLGNRIKRAQVYAWRWPLPEWRRIPSFRLTKTSRLDDDSARG